MTNFFTQNMKIGEGSKVHKKSYEFVGRKMKYFCNLFVCGRKNLLLGVFPNKEQSKNDMTAKLFQLKYVLKCLRKYVD